MQPIKATTLLAAGIALATLGSRPSYAQAPPSLDIHSGTFAQFNFANSAGTPFQITQTGDSFTSNTEAVTFSLYNGASETPVDTVHALMSFAGTAGAGSSGESNIQNITYSFTLDPSYYQGINASNDNLLTIGTAAQPDGTIADSSALLTKGKSNVGALSGETTAYTSDYFYFGKNNDTELNNWSSSFTRVNYSGTAGSLNFTAGSGSGQFDAEEFALTKTLPTPEAGTLIALTALLLPGMFLFGRRRPGAIAAV